MSTNVYNIVWADDDIDALEERYKKKVQRQSSICHR